jgi:hypothetical protein
MSKQQTRLGLDLLDSKLADQVRSIHDNATLRLFACACASLALTYCESSDPRSSRAIEVGRQYAKGAIGDNELSIAYSDAEKAAEAADEIASGIQDAFEDGRASVGDYKRAFGVARAAFSAQYCCHKLSIEAADNAAYEAWAALKTAIEEGSTLGGLVVSGLSGDVALDTAVITILKDILERLL